MNKRAGATVYPLPDYALNIFSLVGGILMALLGTVVFLAEDFDPQGLLLIAVGGLLHLGGSIYTFLRADYERKCRQDAMVA